MTEALFSDIEKKLLVNIKKVKSAIKIAVAWFTNPELYNALADLVDAGKIVEIILADDIVNFKSPKISFQSLIDKGVEIRISRFPRLMHHKFCIIDEWLLITGSYNWTVRAEKNNHENVIRTTDLNLIAQYIDEFIELKNVTERLLLISATQFNSYTSLIEADVEIQLLTEQNSSYRDVEEDEENRGEDIDEETDEKIEEANLLYLKGRHQEAINLCSEIIRTHPDLAEMYEIIALSKWRQGKYREQIQNAEKAVNLDNQYFSAYNILGIGYSHIGNSQKSIDNYKICIKAEPDEYIYYRNRALSYLDLETDTSIPINLRNQFAAKADSDLNTVIEITTRLEKEDGSYQLYFSRGIALLNLNKLYPAKADLLIAKKLYEQTVESEQDTHEFKEIKDALKDIGKALQRM